LSAKPAHQLASARQFFSCWSTLRFGDLLQTFRKAPTIDPRMRLEGTSSVPDPDVERFIMLLNIQSLGDESKCFEAIRALRWPDGVRIAPTVLPFRLPRRGETNTGPLAGATGAQPAGDGSMT
jgi:hypothetical protein